jgi:flagellar hook protein FlgE
MMRSLYSAISGIDVNQKAMDILGNNISNVNTVGYKSGRAVFQDLLSQTLVGGKAPTDARGGINPRQVGLGSYLAAVDTVFETGTMQTTSKNSDLAIQGEGFFVLRGETENDYLYSRAGDFNFDRSGALTNPGGYNVQGWMADPDTGELETNGSVSDIIVDSEYKTIQAQATTEVSMAGVLNSEADPTVVEYPALLHYADPADEIMSIYSENGVKMDLSDNEPIKIKAHSTDMTDMKYVYNSSDVNLNLENDQNLLIYINSTAYTFTYGTDFDTMGELATALETQLDTLTTAGDFNVTSENGTLKVTRAADDGNDISIDSFSGSPYLAVVMSNLSGTFDDVGDTRSSDEMYFESQIYAERDFSNLTELGVKIEQTLDGNVIDANMFNVSYDNTDGTFTYEIDAGASATDVSLSGFSLDKAYSGSVFENNIVPAGSSTITATAGNTATSKSGTFLRTAEDDDPLTELFTSSGDSLGLDATAIIQIDASVAGSDVAGTGSIPANGSTLDDFRKAIADYMGYDSSSESVLAQHLGSFDENDGKLQLTGENGKPNEIDYIKFEVVGGGSYEQFYDYYEYQTVQNASGGQLITSQTIYDSQGEAHTLQYDFKLEDSSDNIWRLTMSSPDSGSTVTFNETTGSDVFLNFNSNGSFNFMSAPDGQRISELTINYDPGTGAGVITDVSVDLGTASKFDGLYVSADEGSISQSEQDGYPTGSLESTLFNPAGEIIGYYTNGQVQTIAQISLAIFTNNQGLLKVGDTTFQATANSGEATIGKPQTSFRGDIASGALENSNVDMSSEFVNMITTQRGFQANSRVITTSDEMLQELMTLKR